MEVCHQTSRDYANEWRFNHFNTNKPPQIGLALSGGGLRSAAYSMGVVRALYEMNILTNVDVISAVSGGSYTLSWLLAQPYYSSLRGQGLSQSLSNMFATNGCCQSYLEKRATLVRSDPTIKTEAVWINAFLLSTIGPPLSLPGRLLPPDNNNFIQHEYRDGIQTAFQAWVDPKTLQLLNLLNTNSGCSFTSVVERITFDEMSRFAESNRLPFFIFNCTAYTRGGKTNQLWAKSFELNADRFGFDGDGYQDWSLTTNCMLRTFNFASAISGAVSCPKYAGGLSDVVSAGNFELGYQIPRIGSLTNCASPKPHSSQSHHIGRFDFSLKGVPTCIHLTDGGHSENLGAYALVRRECSNIIVVDAEFERGRGYWDEFLNSFGKGKTNWSYRFEGYTNLQHHLTNDNELNVSLKVSAIDENRFDPRYPVLKGKIHFLNEPEKTDLRVIYVKSSLDRTNLDCYPPEVRTYAAEHPKFPQESTADINFSIEKFKAYRELGYYTVKESKIFKDLVLQIQEMKN